jgi:hypothetical protein
MKILFITVGSQWRPIVNALRTTDRFDLVFFICSKGECGKGSETVVDGAGNPCLDTKSGRKFESIVKQSELEENRYCKIIVTNPDDLGECYAGIQEVGDILEICSEAMTVCANYSGGTKTMSFALGLAALHYGWELQFNIGPRLDLLKIREGDMPVPVAGVHRIIEDRLGRQVIDAATRYDFGVITGIAESFLKLAAPYQTQIKWNRLRNIATGFVAWDTFDHTRAYELLKSQQGIPGNFLGPLSRLARHSTDELSYDMVADLLNNAARCAARKQYDNAVARLYRATEMTGQIELCFQLSQLSERHKNVSAQKRRRAGNVRAVNLTLELLPSELREYYNPFVREKDRLLLGLRETFLLLEKMDNAAGKLFAANISSLTNALKTRNDSILAHGVTPVSEEQYRSVEEVLVWFIKSVADQGGQKFLVPQFPCILVMERGMFSLR